MVEEYQQAVSVRGDVQSLYPQQLGLNSSPQVSNAHVWNFFFGFICIIENKLGMVDGNLFLKFICVLAFSVTVFELFLIGGVQVFFTFICSERGMVLQMFPVKFEVSDYIV